MTANALILISLGLFLLTRFLSGAVLLYVNQRFAWLCLPAALGLLILGMSDIYVQRVRKGQPRHGSWSNFIVALPVILGVAIPPLPLGATALPNREINALPSAARADTPAMPEKSRDNETILDWVMAFQELPDPTAVADQKARVTGFVYHDERYGDERFLVARFVIVCCVADAMPLGLVVQWPQAATLAKDQWVEVSGRFEAGEFAGKRIPILRAESVTAIQQPAVPYLYP